MVKNGAQFGADYFTRTSVARSNIFVIKPTRARTRRSLTIYVQADQPSDPARRGNWLPEPKDQDFSLYIGTYWPDEQILNGQ